MLYKEKINQIYLMKTSFYSAIFVLALAVSGCKTDAVVDPETYPQRTSPVNNYAGRDSVFTGAYLGISIGEDAAKTYDIIQSLRPNKGVDYINVVSNFVPDVTSLRGRIPLYSYLLLDEARGTDTGVQITLESGKVKVIYLNSGKKLNQWPTGANSKSSVRVGDKAEDLQAKLLTISRTAKYSNKFQRIFLMTKNVDKAYDPGMGLSPQWYFGYKTATGMDVVKTFFKNGKVDHFEIEHYKDL